MVHAAFKTVSNAIELMIASSTTLMQVCKRGAPSARAIGLNEMCGRGSGKAACVSGAKIFCSVQFFEQGPVLSSKCSAEVLDGQLVSAVLRSSVWWDRTLACISCSCRLITTRSVTLAPASTRMRRLLRQQQAVRMALQSCSLITPTRSSACCNDAQVASSVRWVCDSLHT